MQFIRDNPEFSVNYSRAPKEELKKITQTFIKPFELSKAPLMRAALVETAQNEYAWMLDMHHTIYDGNSLQIFKKEFLAIYSGVETLPEPRIQYKDYAQWLNGSEGREMLRHQEEYWLNELGGDLPRLAIQTDFPRPKMQSFAGDVLLFTIDKKKTAALRQLVNTENATLYMVMLTIINILLAKLSGQEDIVIGTPVLGRSHEDLQEVIGMFVNTLVLRNYPAGGKTFLQNLAEVRERTLQAFENQDYQFEEMVTTLGAQRDMSRHPLFDIMYAYQNYDAPAEKTTQEQQEETNETTAASQNPDTDAPALEDLEVEGAISHFDMMFSVFEERKTVTVAVEYATALFKKETIEKIRTHFNEVLTQVLENTNITIKEITVSHNFLVAATGLIEEEDDDWDI
ncbi:MAG: non-ribosomal peptide synthetase, partial [bacterium]|nr:non-ribosomal peptide synthetase [bacterium]